MCQLIESIKIKDNKIYNLDYHNLRFNQSRAILFDSKDIVDLREYIKLGGYNGLYKCRVVYDRVIREISIASYNMRRIKNLKIVFNNEIDYSFKYKNRDIFDKLIEKCDDFTDVLIVKNGQITDTSFSNVIFFDGKRYWTPQYPLLKGTKREKLINEKIIFEKKITLENIKEFQYLQFINAMIDIEDKIIIDIKEIIF